MMDVISIEIVPVKSLVDDENDERSSSIEIITFKNLKTLISISFMLTIGVSGLVLCAIGSNLKSVSNNIGGIDVAILGGNAFMCRGIGSLIGTISCATIFERIKGENVLIAGLLLISSIIFLIPYSTSSTQLYIYFALLGICSAINDTGVNILTRQLHGKEAGPWLGANGIAFGMSASVVPIVESLSSGFQQQHNILAVMILFVASSVLYGDISSLKYKKMARYFAAHIDKQSAHTDGENVAPHYRVEFAIAFMCFCVVGAQVNVIAFFNSYLEITQVVEPQFRGNVLLVFWVFVGLGRILGVLDQRFFISSDSVLITHLSTCCFVGAAALLVLIIVPSSSLALWISIACFALFFGPCISFCYDLNNRLTLPTEKSTAIVMFGVNCGASFVPYFSGLIWCAFGKNPQSLIAIISLCMVSPLTIIHFIQSISYQSRSVSNQVLICL